MSKAIPRRRASRGTRLCIAILEIVFVCGLLAVWFGVDAVRSSKNLWILFFYNFPSQFLIAIVPHEPVFLYFSKFYPAWMVTGVALTGTLLTEMLNYSCFSFFTDLSIFEKIKRTRFISYLIRLFNKIPFLALWIAGFTPVPFYPFRFLVVLASYPIWKYLLAVLPSRAPRFFILALVGRSIKIPDMALAIFFIAITILLNLPFLKTLQKSRKAKPETEISS